MSIVNMLAAGPQYQQIEPRVNALMRAQEARGMQQRNLLMQQQMQAAQTAQAEQSQNNALLQRLAQSIPSPQSQASQQALAGGGGPTVANAAKMQPVDPRMQMLHTMMQQSGGKLVSPVDYVNQAMPAPEKPRDMVVGGDIVRLQGGKATPIYKGEQKDPEDVRLLKMIHGDGTPAYQAALAALGNKKTTHQPGVSVSYGAPQAGMDDKGNPVFFQPSKSGGAPAIVPGVRPQGDGEKPLTEGQAKAVTFSARMLSADKTLAELSRKGVNVSVPGSGTGYGVGAVINAISPADQQRLDQAKRDFINATLRRESGAVINPDEFQNADKQYFPQVGDSRQVMEQKARNRRVAIEGIRADVPKGKQSEVDRISTGGSAGGPSNDDPLGLRGGK